MKFDDEQQELWDRLNGFLDKLSGRHTEILEEAGAGLTEMLDADSKDTQSIGQVVMALRDRSIKLRSKIDDTFSDEIQDQFHDANWDTENRRNFMDIGIEHVDGTTRRLEADFMRFEAQWTAAPYRRVWPEVKVAVVQPAQCSQCGGGLDDVDRKVACSSTCGSCGAVNQFTPENWVRMYFHTHGAVHAFANEWAVEQRIAIEEYRARVELNRGYNDHRKESVESLDRWHEMEKHYWAIYGHIRQRMTGETDAEIEAHTQPRLDQFVQHTLMSEGHWKRAKGL
jgi:hypothetical protein